MCYGKRNATPILSIFTTGFTFGSLLSTEWIHIANVGSRGLWLQCTKGGVCQLYDGEPYIKAVRAFFILELICLIPAAFLNILSLYRSAEFDKWNSWARGLFFLAWICLTIAMSVVTGVTVLQSGEVYGWGYILGWVAFAFFFFCLASTFAKREARSPDVVVVHQRTTTLSTVYQA